MLTLTMRTKTYWVTYRDPEGNEYEYVVRAPSRRRARADAERWVGVGRSDWNATLVSVTRFPSPTPTRRLLCAAGIMFVAGSTAIAVAAVVGLSLQGALWVRLGAGGCKPDRKIAWLGGSKVLGSFKAI